MGGSGIGAVLESGGGAGAAYLDVSGPDPGGWLCVLGMKIGAVGLKGVLERRSGCCGILDICISSL